MSIKINLNVNDLSIKDGELRSADSGPDAFRAKLARDGSKEEVVASKLEIEALHILVRFMIRMLENTVEDPDDIIAWADDPQHDHVFEIDSCDFACDIGYEPYTNDFKFLEDETFSEYFCGDDFYIDDPFCSNEAFTVHMIRNLNAITCELDYCEHPLIVFLGHDGMTRCITFSSPCLLKLIASTLKGNA